MRKLITLVLATILLAAVAYLGWRWLDDIPIERIAIRGAVQADSAAILELAGVEPGMSLMAQEPRILADRIQRHPWVLSASASRQPTGTLVLSVREREPVALALDASGQPAYYLDEEGFRMPVIQPLPLDVPIVRNLRDAYHPVVPIASAPIRAFVSLLPDLEDLENALLSEIHETDLGIDLYTAVTPAGQSIRIRLGRDGFEEKLDLLQAFWMQAVLARPTKQYDWVDLRFEGQVVTRERA